MNDLISIVMPVKNAMPYLDECLSSIKAQTYNNWELLAVNDNSNDASLDLLEQWAKRDERIKVFENNGSGIIPALQLAYANSNGAFITRMDADDIMVSIKLETMVDQLRHRGEGFVATGLVKYFSENGLGEGYQKYAQWLNDLTQTGSNFDDRYKECVIPSPCWMLYQSDFEKIGGFDSDRYPEDYDLVFRMYREGLKVIPCAQVLHHWRDYPNRTSRTDANYADNRFLDLKLHYFLQIDFDPKKRLLLWGAGKKGKLTAQYLQENRIDFSWLSNNEKKIGKEIYSQSILDPGSIELSNSQILLAIAGKTQQQDLMKRLISVDCNFYFLA